MRNGQEYTTRLFPDDHEEGTEPLRFVTVALRPATRTRLFGVAGLLQLKKGGRVTMDETINSLIDMAGKELPGQGEGAVTDGRKTAFRTAL